MILLSSSLYCCLMSGCFKDDTYTLLIILCGLFLKDECGLETMLSLDIIFER